MSQTHLKEMMRSSHSTSNYDTQIDKRAYVKAKNDVRNTSTEQKSELVKNKYAAYKTNLSKGLGMF